MPTIQNFIVNKVFFFSSIGNILELSCLEVCLQPNLTYSLSSLNFSFVTFLEPVRETETIMGIFLNHSSFQNFTRMCQDITSEFAMCSLCLVCESKGNMDFISQEQTSQGKCKGTVRIKFIKDKWPYSVIKDINSTFQFWVHWHRDTPWGSSRWVTCGALGYYSFLLYFIKNKIYLKYIKMPL